MKMNLFGVGVAFLLSILPACGGAASAAGVYELDKDALQKAMAADMPAGTPAEMVKGMLDSMKMSIELKADGTAVATVNMMGKDDGGTGTWKLTGDTISMTMKGKDGKEDTKDGKYSNGVITITEEKAGKKMEMILRRK